MGSQILEYFLKILALLGIGIYVGKQLGKAETEAVSDELRRAKSDAHQKAAADDARTALAPISNEELVDRVAAGRDPQTGQDIKPKPGR
jgi:hypothetical protein